MSVRVPNLIKHYPTTYIDQGGPCGHASPDGLFDDCLCRDGYVIPAHFSYGYSPNYCEGPDPWADAPF